MLQNSACSIYISGFFTYFQDAEVLHRLHRDVLLNATYFYFRSADVVTVDTTGNEEQAGRFVESDVRRRRRQEPEAKGIGHFRRISVAQSGVASQVPNPGSQGAFFVDHADNVTWCRRAPSGTEQTQRRHDNCSGVTLSPLHDQASTGDQL